LKLLFDRLTSFDPFYKIKKYSNKYSSEPNSDGKINFSANHSLTLLHFAEYHQNESLAELLTKYSSPVEVEIFSRTKFLSGLAPTQNKKHKRGDYCTLSFKIKPNTIDLHLEFNSVDDLQLIKKSEEYYLLYTCQISGMKTMAATCQDYTIELTTKQIHFIALEKSNLSHIKLIDQNKSLWTKLRSWVMS